MYVRDLLLNTYKGGTRDHYAIMADISEAEVDYWRINYGIHLVGYSTTQRGDKSRDHSALLKLLDDLRRGTPPSAIQPSAGVAGGQCSPDVILALARHAARLTRAPKIDPEFPIRVHLEQDRRPNSMFDFRHDEFDHCPVDRFLDEGPARALLIGLPGSGKSYSLQRAAARLAERLHESCLSEPFEEKAVVVPLLADLKLYGGDVKDLLNKTLPNGLSLDELIERFGVKIFLDSFNEIPRDYWESGSYEADFTQFAEGNSAASLIIGSRTSDGLSKLGFPSYSLDQIEDGFVAAELQRLKIDIGGRFQREVRSLLQKPFYFQLVANRTVSLPEEPHPRDFYQAFFRQLTHSFKERFGQPFNLEEPLSLAAYEAINRGQEAQPVADFVKILEAELQGAGIADIRAQDVANWLVSKSVVIPYTGGRIAFFHQSATEYLAASELSRRYQASPHIIEEKLRLTRWDQCLLLTLSLLPEGEAAVFLQALVDADFYLALNATKCLEFDRDEVVAKLLSEIPDRIKADPFDLKLVSALEFGLVLSEAHEAQLRRLVKCGNVIGAAAAARLLEIRGTTVKEELLLSLVEARDDYNYCSVIGRALQRFATPDDVQRILALTDSLEGEIGLDDEDRKGAGFVSGAATFLSEIGLSVIRKAFLPKDESETLSEVRARILCDILRDRHSTAALDLAGDLLFRGVDNAATIIYFISNFAKPEDRLSWATFRKEHVDRLVSKINDPSNKSWALSALNCLCKARPDVAEAVTARSSKVSGLLRAMLLNCASRADVAPVFEALAELAEMSVEKRAREPIHLVEQIELNWAGREALFVQLLRLRDTRLALALIRSLGFFPTIGELAIGPVDWWLEWFMEEKDTELGYWFHHEMAQLFAKFVNAESRKAFVTEFNRSGSEFRKLLARSILPYWSDLTTDVFSEDAISFLLSDLNQDQSAAGFRGRLLGTTATEKFVIERLLPLFSDAKPPLSENLRKVLTQAGSRHGRRYVTT